MIFILFIVVVIVYLIQRKWKMKEILKLSRLLRSKYTAWPIVGHGLMFLGSAEDRMAAIQNFARETIKSKHGMTSCWLGSQLCVVTCDAATVEVVMKTCLGKTDIITNTASHLLGNASIFAPVHIWRPRRKVLANAFSMKKLRNYVEIFAEQSAILTQSLRSVADGETFPMWKYISLYTMDAVCETTLGVKMHAQVQPKHTFLAALSTYLRIIPLRLILPYRHLDWLFHLLPIFKEMENAKIIIHDFVDELIRKKHISIEHEYINSKDNMPVQIRTENSQTNRNKSFLDEMILSSKDGNGFTNIELREEVLTLLIGGIDTNATGAACAIVMLSRYMDIQEKAYQEVYNIFGDSKRHVTFEDLPKLIYIEALIKETLRLYPPSTILLRENDVNVPLASGIILPAGTYTGINIWGLHRNPRYWGPDVEEFNPDRFLNGSPTERTAFLPFGFGPRDCLGYKYAMMSMKVVVTSLLREYKVLPPSDLTPEDLKKPLRVEFRITMTDVDDYKVRLECRY